jgi:hypothetical protein
VAHYLLAATAYDLLRQGEGTTKESKQLEARWINEAFASLQALDTMAAPGVFPERHLYRGLLNEVLFRRSGAEAARLAAVGAFRTFLAAAEANGMADDDPLVRTARERLKALDH